MKSQAIQILILTFLFGCVTEKRIGYYDGIKFINCDKPSDEIEKSTCDKVNYFYGK